MRRRWPTLGSARSACLTSGDAVGVSELVLDRGEQRADEPVEWASATTDLPGDRSAEYLHREVLTREVAETVGHDPDP